MATRNQNRTVSPSPVFRRSALSLAIALALPGMAFAQSSIDEERGDDEEMVMEEVIVTGRFRASLIDALGT